MDLSLSKLWGIVNREAWHGAVHVITESDMTERMSNNSNQMFAPFPSVWDFVLFNIKLVMAWEISCNSESTNL